MVILEPFWRMDTGKWLLGRLVSQRRKSRCTWKSRGQHVLRGCRHSHCSCSCTDPLVLWGTCGWMELDLGSSQGSASPSPRAGRLPSGTTHLAGVNALNQSLQ